LDVDVGVRVGAAVEDVHHRHRQDVGVGPADVLVQRHAGGVGGGAGHGQGHTEDGVGSDGALVRGAVELDHRGVDVPLLLVVHAQDLRLDVGDVGYIGVPAGIAVV